MVREATRISTTSRSVLDLVLTNNPSKLTNLEVIPGISDHLAISFQLQWHPPRQKLVRRVTRNYHKADWQLLKTLLNMKMPQTCADFQNLEVKWSCWKEVFWECVDEAVPSGVVSAKRRAPWISGEIIRQIHKRDYLYRKWKKCKTTSNWESYRIARNKVKNEARGAHEEFIWKLGVDDGKKLWRYIHGKTGSSAPQHFNIGGVLVNDSQKIANDFALHFHGNYTRDGGDYVDHSSQQSAGDSRGITLETIDFHPSEVVRQLKRIKPNSATGPDQIPARILHECATELGPSLSSLFQTSLSVGAIPEEWKHANVVPIYKTGSRNQISNYRPISLTSIVCKVMEKVVSKQLLDHLRELNVINSQQHGFLPGRSCVTMLAGAVDEWQYILDKVPGARIDVISLDWAKAFDRVHHGRLLDKLKIYEVSGNLLKWMTSFLIGRKMKVLFNGSCSAEQDVMSGVPQGSVLGPLLFTTFMLDLPQCVDSTMCQYADDCTVYRHIKSPVDEQVLQSDLKKIEEWCNANVLALNQHKCQYMQISRAKTKSESDYYINGNRIVSGQNMRILGVTVTCQMKWNIQTEMVRVKAAKALGFISRILKGARPKVKRTVYLGLVRPILTYGCPAWHPSSLSNIKKLELIQDRASKFITGRPDLSKRDRRIMCSMLSINDLLSEIDVLFFKKMLLNIIEIDPYVRVSVNPENRSRHSVNGWFIPPFARTTDYQQAFYFRTVQFFNSLPQYVRQEECFKAFKIQIRSYLVDKTVNG